MDMPDDLIITDNMNTTQKAYTIAKYTIDHKTTAMEMASRTGFSYRQIISAMQVLKTGTDEDKKDLQNGKPNSYAIIQRRKKLNTADPPLIEFEQPAKKHLPKRLDKTVTVPEKWPSLSAWCRAGIEMEITAGSLENAANAIGMHYRTFRRARDIVLLNDRTDLSPAEAELARQAFERMDETRSVRTPYTTVLSILKKIAPRRFNIIDDEKRIEPFRRALIAIESSCEYSTRLEVPHLSEVYIKEFTNRLKQAIRNLRKLNTKIGSAKC